MASAKRRGSTSKGSSAVPPAMRVLLARVFGTRSKAACRTHMTDPQWREVMKALLGELHRYQIANIRTDEFHELVLASALTSADGALSTSDYWPGYAEGILRFALTLMGDYPDHRHRKPGRKNVEHYDLTLRRSVAYNQSTAQRYRTLCVAVDLGLLGAKKKMWELMEPFHEEHGTRYSQRQQLEWFRKTYPDLYARAFP